MISNMLAVPTKAAGQAGVMYRARREDRACMRGVMTEQGQLEGQLGSCGQSILG